MTRTRSRIATTGALAALMTAGLAGGALAADPDGLGPLPPTKIVSKAELAKSRSFSQARIERTADPLPAPRPIVPLPPEPEGPDGPGLKVPGVLPKSDAAARTATRIAPRATAAQNGAWPGAHNANPNRQIGKLYFDKKIGPGEDWRHCTATLVNSENKAMVVTAGHCVYDTDPDRDGDNRGDGYIDGDGYWFENVQFWAGYENGKHLGVWHARYASTTNSWFYGTGTPRRYDWSDDFAVVVLKPNSAGRLPVNLLGGHGIAFNQNVGLNRHAFGYPVTDYRFPGYTYSGNDLIYCNGRDSYSADIMTLGCTMTGGASGGPWLINPNASWMGTLNGVNSHKQAGTTMSSPYLGADESTVFQYHRAR